MNPEDNPRIMCTNCGETVSILLIGVSDDGKFAEMKPGCGCQTYFSQGDESVPEAWEQVEPTPESLPDSE